METAQKIHRRDFIRSTALSGVAFFLLGYQDIEGEPLRIVQVSGEDSLGTQINAYIYIDSSGRITLFNNRPEMGQGTFESIPMIIAEELEVDIEQFSIMASPADRKLYGDQMVVGSRSIAGNYDLMRRIGASAREMLISAAARRWKVSEADCYARHATVIHRPSGKILTYAELAGEAAKLSPPQDPTLKDPADFTLIGTSPQRQDIPVKTDGSAVFGIDCEVEGMLFASIERSPVLMGKLIRFDDTQARAVQGVKYVMKTQRDLWGHRMEGVAVVADNYWAALEGRKKLVITWDNGDLESWSTEKIQEDYKNASSQDGIAFQTRGSFDQAFGHAPVQLTVSYRTPYQAHAPLEPMNGIVFAQKDKVEYWGSTQNPNGFRSQLARQCGVKEENVIIHYTFMGGAFGRRSLTDVPQEAAELSLKTGAPIKVIWTREDDLSQGPFRACSLNVCRGAVDQEGTAIGLEHKVICQDIRNQTGNDDTPSDGIAGGINTDYAIPNLQIKGVLRKLYIPVSYWRSVYHSTNCFAHESFMDELALAAKKDPLDFRLSLLTQHGRYTALLNTVAEKSNWHQPRDKDTGLGVAIVERSGSFVAAVASVSRIQGKVKPLKLIIAIDCGIAVDPDTIKAQTEGCAVMALSATYKGGITFEKGRVADQNFNRYQLLRIHECPEIEVIVMKNNFPPQGVGEGGLPPIAPALTNALFNLTGKRIRELPFNLDLIS